MISRALPFLAPCLMVYPISLIRFYSKRINGGIPSSTWFDRSRRHVTEEEPCPLKTVTPTA